MNTSTEIETPINILAQSLEWEEKHRAVRHFEIRMDNIVPLQNNRLTTEWNCLLLAKSILENGGWLQTDPFRFKLQSAEDWERNKKALIALESRADSLQHGIDWRPEMFGITDAEVQAVENLRVDLVDGYHRTGKDF